jgi:hypothetical protein
MIKQTFPLLIPIHPAFNTDMEYARAYLPVLAALMFSGHLRDGDIIDLPIPYPEVWPQTVAWVYTRQGELTDGMKHNIWYLAGKP